MPPPARLYTPAEAAAISGLPIKAVNNAIDKHIVDVPRTATAGRKVVRRYLTKGHLICFRLERGLVGSLPVERRRILFKSVTAQPASEHVDADDVLTVNVAKARFQIEERARRLAEAEGLIHSDKDTLNGEPVIKDTRMPVYHLVALIENGATIEELMAGSPTLDAHKVELAKMWVAAHPRRGRPKRLADHGFILKSTTRRSLPKSQLD
jgi:uncharacterized protein (DUF433 family)